MITRARTVCVRVVLGCVAGLLGGCQPAADPLLEQVVKEIGQKASAIRSYQADVTLSMGAVTIQELRIFQFPNQSYIEAEMQTGTAKSRQITVLDGKWKWHYLPTVGVTKVDMEKVNAALPGGQSGVSAPLGSSDLTREALQGFDRPSLRYLGAEQFDGTRVHVLEGDLERAPTQAGKGNTPTPSMFRPVRMRVWIGADDGIRRRVVMLDKDGKETMSETCTNVKTNQKYPDSRFQFTPPPGVQVIDTTELTLMMMKPMAAGQPATGLAPAPPAAAPAAKP